MLKAIFYLFSVAILVACTQSDQPSQQYKHAVEGAFAAEISQNGAYSIVSSIHHGISYWDNRAHKLLYQWQHNKQLNNDVFIVRISADNSCALSAIKDEFVVWNTQTGKETGFYQVSESPIRDIQLSANGRYILYAQVNSKVVHIDLKTGRRLEMPIHHDKVNSVDLSANGLYALSAGNDHQAFLWNTQTAEVLQKFSFKHRISTVKLEKSGRYAFIGYTQKPAQIWDIQTKQLHSQLIYSACQSIFSSLRFVNNGQQILTGNGTKKATLWDVDSGLAVQKWRVTSRKDTRPSTAVVYSATLWGDNQIATESSAGFLEIWPIKK